MSVNNIDFTLGSYNPNQAAGLIAMAQENDRKISDSLKGILDGFEKTARSNADVQAMNYINSLGLQDMTPDKMAGHTQALEQIAGNMGGLNPSKEALTALDGRGNVLTQRAMNDASLKAQDIANTSNRYTTEEKGDARALVIAINSAIANPSMAGDIKNILPLHLQAMFDEQALYRREEQKDKLNALNESIETKQAKSAYDAIYAYLPLFKSSDGMVDYDSMFKNPDVLKALGTDINNPRVLGKVLQTMDKKSAEDFEAAFKRSMRERQVGVAEGTLRLGQDTLTQKGAQWEAEQRFKEEEANRRAKDEASKRAQDQANKTNDAFQKSIKGSVLSGSVAKNADGTLQVDAAKLAASIDNRLSNAAKPVEVTYKAASVDAWWIDNKDFGTSKLTFMLNLGTQTGVKDTIKTQFASFKPDGKPLTKDTQIAMLEKLKASADTSTNLGFTSVKNMFGKSPYVTGGKLDMDSLYAAVINDRIAEANKRVKDESSKILRDASDIGLDIGQIAEYLPQDFARRYGSIADSGFMKAVTFVNHNSSATAPLSQSGGYNNNLLDKFRGKPQVGTNTVRR